MEGMILRLAGLVPRRYKNALLGAPDRPRKAAKVVHSLINMLPAERRPIVSCSGVLRGCRMRLDWHRDRSFAYGTYEQVVVEAILNAVASGEVAFDVGASIGFYTLLLSRLAGQRGQVMAFEPHPENFAVLQENVRLNRCTNVTLRNEALADKGGQAGMSVSADPLPRTGSIVADEDPQRVIVNTTCVDEVIGRTQLPLGFMKIDVEGAEALVLKGAIQTIRRHHPRMIIELHHFDQYGENHQVLGLLAEFGYEIRWLDRLMYTAHVFAKPAATAALPL